MGRKTHGPYLLAAIEHNDIKKINEILNSQIRNKAKTKEFLVSDVRRLASEFSEVPLLLAACNDDPTIIKYFVTKHGADINHVHEEGFGRKKKRKSALTEAVRRGLYATVDAILALNADANQQDHKGRTALHHAVRKADFRMVKMLCSHGAQVNVTDKASNTPLHMATIFGHLELVKVLIKHGGDLYKKGQHGAIPIHIAAREGHSALVRLFCQYDVNVNIKVPCYEGQERAPIHVAAEEGHAETVFSLLDSCGADVGIRDSEGESPLHCCVIREYDPLGMKSKEDYTETIKVLLNFGASVNLQNRRGETPMHLAARNEFQKMVEVLVLAGGDPLIEDFDGNKPIDLVFPDDTVTRQILKNAQEERERYMSEAIEIRAKGFTTSILKPLPLSMRSQSTMNMMGGFMGGTMNSSISRAASVPGLLNNPMPIYEDGYMAPQTVRNQMGPGRAYSQANTYKSSNSRSTGSSSGSHVVAPHPQPSQVSTYAHIDDSVQQVYKNDVPARRVSESSQPQQPPMLTQRKRAQSEEALNSPDLRYHDRSLPSPPAQRKMQNSVPQNPRANRDSTTSDATSFWSVSTQDHTAPGPPARQAGIAKRQAAPLRFIPVGPHGQPEQSNQSEDDSYFDDESFDTLDTLSQDDGEPGRPMAQLVMEANRKHQEMYEKKKKIGGSQDNLNEWLEEQAEYIQDRGPVAQSTPPRGRKAAKNPTEGGHPPVPPKPVPRGRTKSVDALESRKPLPPPKPTINNNNQGDVNKVIQLEVDDSQGTGQTIIRVLPVSTPTDGLSESEQPGSDPGSAPQLPPRKAEKPKVGKKPKTKTETNGEEAKPEKKKKKKGTKKRSLPQPPEQDIEGNEIYEHIKDSDLSMEAEQVQPQAEEKAKKKSVSQKRQEMFQEQLIHDKEQQEQMNREREAAMREQHRRQEQEMKMKREEEERQREEEFERQREEELQQQREEQQRRQQAEMQRQLLEQQQSIDDAAQSPKRKVTIGNEEVHHLKRSPDEGCRVIVYNFNGAVPYRLVGGNKEGIFVSDVEPNSDPAQNGLTVGDQIVRINGRSCKGRTKEEAYSQLVNTGVKVSLLVRSNRVKCSEILEHGGEGDLMFMEACFDHDPSQPGELIVRKGDIFAVRDSLPEGFPGSWAAVKVKGKTAEEESAWKPLMAAPKDEEQRGLIPNVQRAKQIMVKESLLSNKPTSRGGLFTRSFGRSKSQDRQNKQKDAEKRAAQEASMMPYHRVTEQGFTFKRPVVLLGLFCDVVRQQLLRDSPSFFATPEGDLEVPSHMGPVDVEAIKYIMDMNKHCVIIMSPKGIKHLQQNTDFSPIVIYLNPVNKNVIKVVKNKLCPDYEKKVNYMYDEAVKFEKQYSSIFTNQVQYSTDDSWFVLLKNTIIKQQDTTFWRPYSPDDESSDEEGDDDAVQMRGRSIQPASRISKTTDDLPDPRMDHSLQHMPTQDEETEDDFDSDESEDPLDAGMRRPAQGGFQAVDPVQRPTQPVYAQPNMDMKMRNRSTGDILQYMHNDFDGPPPQQYQHPHQPPPNRFQYQQPHGPPQPQFAPRPNMQPMVHPGYVSMRPGMQIQRPPGPRGPGPQGPPFQQQRPPMMQQRKASAPSSNHNNRETQL